MKKHFALINLMIIAIIFLIYTSFVQAQTTETGQDIVKLKQITRQAESHFNKGLAAINEQRRSEARQEFDKSVEVFMDSAINIQENQKLRGCFDQLIETIHQIEFPDEKKTPNTQILSETCSWNIKDAEDSVESNDTQNGFTEQKYEPSPLDELAKLELNEEEKQVDGNPVARQQYQLVQVAEASKSYGFHFQMHPMVQQFVNYYQGRGRSTMEIGLYRSGQFMRMARRIFREEGVPENVAWLGQVESAWKPTARSWAAAAGLWQFIPGTGARYGLRVNGYMDERNSFEKATRASAQYLKFLANRYNGNWELAMAAYNSGEGNVDRAIRRAGVANFWLAFPYLPRETRNYVPNILATILIANNPNGYGFGHVRPAPQLLYETVRVPALTNLVVIAQASNTTIEYIRYLNPEFRSNSTPPEPYIIRVPMGKANEVVAIFRGIPSQKSRNTAMTKAVVGMVLQNRERQ